MKRDELLTRLAMEMTEWPKRSQDIFDWADGKGFSSVRDEGASGVIHAIEIDGTPIAHAEYLAERERLINKPSWDDAPGWANYLCQQQAGAWCWYAYEPDLEWNKWAGGASNRSLIGNCGQLPAGHDWRQTLEHRPVTQTADPVAEDEACREAERKLREAELTRHITPAELVNRHLMQRCDELQESNARLADENQRLRRTIGELCA